MNLVNCTPHEITVFDFGLTDQSNPRRLMLPSGTAPLKIIPTSGIVLNATKAESTINEELTAALGVKVKSTPKFVAYDPLPEGDFFLVSRMYKQAVSELGGDTSKLLTVGETVFTPDKPSPAGCCSLEF